MNSKNNFTNIENIHQCYLCNCTKSFERPGSVRDNKNLKILECSGCGLVFLSSFDHVKDTFYEESSMHGSEPLDVETWIKDSDVDDERRFQYLKPIITNKDVLDFGCGAGGFIFKARHVTKSIQGLEPETRLHNHFHNNQLNVLSSLSELSDNKKYNIITMFHVLEHIPDPKSLLNKLKTKLAKDGEIIIEIPSANDALISLFENESFSKFTYWSCHLFLFAHKTLKLLARQSGLKVNYIKQIQRYSLANHLHWLSKGTPGGHKKWHFLDSPELHRQYEQQLAAIGKCDTIICSFSNSSH